MADLNLKKQEMTGAIKKLKTQLSNFQSLTQQMSKSVDCLCDNWKAQASETYRTDYKKLTKNFKDTSEVVDKLIKSTEKYLADMDKLDAAYSKSKVFS